MGRVTDQNRPRRVATLARWQRRHGPSWIHVVDPQEMKHLPDNRVAQDPWRSRSWRVTSCMSRALESGHPST